MTKHYYHDTETLKNQRELIKSAAILEEDKLLPSIDGKFSPYRYFKHEVTIQPSSQIEGKVLLNRDEISNIKKESIMVPYTVPAERSFAIVELQDLTNEKRITSLLYDAIYEGIPISDLKIGLEIIARRILDAVKEKADKIVLSDTDVLPARVPIPLVFVLPFVEKFLEEEGVDFSSLSIFIETAEVFNPFEIATLLSLGAKGVYTKVIEEELIDTVNLYLSDLVQKKGYQTFKSYINSKNIKVIGLKEEFLNFINLPLKPLFEVEGLAEIESYIFSVK